MEMKTTVVTIFFVYLTLITITSVSCRTHGHHRRQSHDHTSNEVRPWRQSDDDDDTYDIQRSHGRKHHHAHKQRKQDSEEEDGRHVYVMTTDHLKKVTPEEEDQTLTQAFQQHMKPSNANIRNPHDVYAYKLPSDLWFIVRYTKSPEGHVEKYMNVVSSFTNYLDKLDSSAKSVSVNVSGVETVFRLTSKSKPEA